MDCPRGMAAIFRSAEVSAQPRRDIPGDGEFRLDRLTDYSDQEILSELRRVALLVDRPKLTIHDFRRHARVSYGAVRAHFRGWREALDAADLGHRYSGQSLEGRMRGPRPARGMSDEAILRELRALALGLGRDTLLTSDLKDHPFLSAMTVFRRFGRWRWAMERAGLKTGRYKGIWSEGECFENLMEVWAHLGRAPRFAEMSRPPSRIGAHPYLRRWGTWRRALRWFAEKANGMRNESGDPDSKSISADAATVRLERTVKAAGEIQNQPGPERITRKAGQEDTRHVPVSLRFQILQRDRFKCTLCGASPALDPLCRLHVDHVIPWSRGGRTEPGNLTTLCKTCNLGKGDSLPSGKNKMPPVAAHDSE